MKATYIEIEATREEIAASNTLADGLSRILRRAFNSYNFSSEYSDYEEQTEDEEDE